MRMPIGDAALAPAVRQDVYDLIETERLRQEHLKAAGRFKYTCADPEMTTDGKFYCLGEEFGEVARALVEGAGLANDVHNVDLKKELVHVAAVATAWLESLIKGA